MAKTVRVAVTGAAGQVAYTLLVRLASGEVFGPDVKVRLSLLEVPRRADWQPRDKSDRQAMDRLEGVALELDDCAFPTLGGIDLYDDPLKGFDGVNWALLIGSFPRGPGMERKELLEKNGSIFVPQGKALAARAATGVRALVVGNPCNTNCLIASRNGKDIPAAQWHAMTRLDHNRAASALAKKAGVMNEAVTRMTIWGNHSNTQFPDFTNAHIDGRSATDAIPDRAWLEGSFVPQCQERGKAIIEKRGLSSAISAASGALDHVKTFVRGTPAGDWTSAAVVSNGEYGVPPGLVFGYPLTVTASADWKVVEGLQLDAFGRAKFQKTLDELLAEQADAKALLPD